MRHATRIAIIWLAASIIFEILIAIAPVPAPDASPEGAGARQTVYMLLYVGAPIFVFVWVLFLYCIAVFRRRPGEDVDRPAPPDSAPILMLWAGLSFVIVLFLAGWGTFTLHEITQAPSPVIASAATVVHGKPVSVTVAKPVQPL